MKHRNKAEWWLPSSFYAHLDHLDVFTLLRCLRSHCTFSKLFLKGNIRATHMRDISYLLVYDLLNPFELQGPVVQDKTSLA